MQQSGRATCATRRRSCRRSIPDEGPRETFGSLRDLEKHLACSLSASQKRKFSKLAGRDGRQAACQRETRENTCMRVAGFPLLSRWLGSVTDSFRIGYLARNAGSFRKFRF